VGGLRFRGRRRKRGCEGGRLNVNHALIDACIWFGLSFLGRYDLLWATVPLKWFCRLSHCHHGSHAHIEILRPG
jgi:hypothetical protein